MLATENAESAGLLRYLDSVHERTRRLVLLIPSKDPEWTPHPGRFSFGGLVRHIARTERWMWAETIAGRASRYPGHGAGVAQRGEELLAEYDALHAESRTVFASLTDTSLSGLVRTPAGACISVRAWLRAMTEHEAHHRGQLYMTLALRGVPTPPIFGLTEGEVVARSLPLRVEALDAGVDRQR